jgi:hypothetical protein
MMKLVGKILYDSIEAENGKYAYNFFSLTYEYLLKYNVIIDINSI